MSSILSTSYVKFLQKCARGSEGTVTHACYATRVYTCVLRIRARQDPDSTFYIRRESGFLVYIDFVSEWLWLIGYYSVSMGFSSIGLIWLYFTR